MAVIKLVALVMGAMVSLASPVSAKDWSDAGGFTIIEGGEYCAFKAEYKGPGDTRLMIALHRDGEAYIIVENTNWTAKADEIYKDIELKLDGTSYGGASAMGTEDGIYKGFIVKSAGDIINHLAASTYLHVYKGDQIIDRLSMDGSAAAVAAVRRCVAYVDGLRKAEERERRKYEDLPKDPFGK